MNNRPNNRISKALHISEKEGAQFKTVELPALKNDEVIVAPTFLGICGSDLKLFNNTYLFPHSKEVIPGHEWVGYIKEVGENVKDFSVGERVTGECSVFCGKCYYCTDVNKNLCETILKHGISTNGFASEQVVVNQSYVHSLEDIDCADEMAVFIEPIAVVLQGLKEINTDFSKIRSVLILGAGTIGLLTGLALKSKNKNLSVSIADTNEIRLAIAEQIGLAPIQCDLNDLSKHIAFTQFDMMVESSGFDGYINIIENHVRPAGHVLLFTMNGRLALPQDLIVKNMIKFHGNLGGAGSFPDAIQLLLENKKYISLLVDQIIAFNQLPEVINNKAELLSKGIKTIIRM